ncbi:hypothetical protein CsSME_00032050 [Camellia sinensis var. sinensis]
MDKISATTKDRVCLIMVDSEIFWVITDTCLKLSTKKLQQTGPDITHSIKAFGQNERKQVYYSDNKQVGKRDSGQMIYPPQAITAKNDEVVSLCKLRWSFEIGSIWSFDGASKLLRWSFEYLNLRWKSLNLQRSFEIGWIWSFEYLNLRWKSLNLQRIFEIGWIWSFEIASIELRISESSLEITESSTELRNRFDLELRWSFEIASMELREG